MAGNNAMEEILGEATLLGRPAMFTPGRLDRDTVPAGYHLYELRYDDANQLNPVEVAKSIFANHYGTVITREEIALPPDGFLSLEPGALLFVSGDCRSMAGFIEKYPPKEPPGDLDGPHFGAEVFPMPGSSKPLVTHAEFEGLLKEGLEKAIRSGAPPPLTPTEFTSALGGVIQNKTGTAAEQTICLNGYLRPGDLVISTGDTGYAWLVGTVTKITPLGSPEHDTGNDTDDVHVNFADSDYSDQRSKEIEAWFSELYGEPKTFDELSLDEVIMPPTSLIEITGMAKEYLTPLLNSRAEAENYCDYIASGHASVDFSRIEERLNKNLADYDKSLEGFGTRELIEMADTTAAMHNAHYYLTTSHGFEDGEIEYLLRFANPLEIIADEWKERVTDLSDMGFAIDHVLYNRSAEQDGYPLVPDVTPPKNTRPEAEPAQRPKKAKTTGKKTSLEDRLRNADRKVKAQQPSAPSAPGRKKQERL